MNFSNHFLFSGLQSSQSSLHPSQHLNLPNYQHFSFPQYFWVDENYLLSTPHQYLTYPFQPCPTTDMMFLDAQTPFSFQKAHNNQVFQIQTPENESPLKQISVKYIQNCQNQFKKTQGAFMFCNSHQQDQKLSESTIEKPQNYQNKQKDFHNSFQQDSDKKQIQNLRYQKKNIQANIVNKIYTYLKTCLKLGDNSPLKQFKNKQKAVVYYKVLEKLEKAKKQNIKREFLKGLISMQSSMPGYSKIAKELTKKGESIQQFEYNIRIIIKNYLRFDAINSILTSKKMNPQLWKDHIQKIREIEEYLFSAGQKQNGL